MTNALNIKKIAATALVSLCGMGVFASTGNAMTLHNCTDSNMQVVLENKDGNYTQAQLIKAQRTANIHATSSLGPFRIILPELGQGAHFSGRDGAGTYSLIWASGGNIGLRNGNVCQQQPARTGNTGGGNSEVCVRNSLGLEVCLRP